MPENELKETLLRHGVIYNKEFSNSYEINSFLELLRSKFIQEEKLQEYYKITKQYFLNEIRGEDALFDIGYSGRLQAHIARMIEKAPSIFLVHLVTIQLV